MMKKTIKKIILPTILIIPMLLGNFTSANSQKKINTNEAYNINVKYTLINNEVGSRPTGFYDFLSTQLLVENQEQTDYYTYIYISDPNGTKESSYTFENWIPSNEYFLSISIQAFDKGFYYRPEIVLLNVLTAQLNYAWLNNAYNSGYHNVLLTFFSR